MISLHKGCKRKVLDSLVDRSLHPVHIQVANQSNCKSRHRDKDSWRE